MSFDAFEARLQFLQLIRKLNASSQSIQKVVGFAVKYGSRCGEDLWECVMEECAKVSLRFSSIFTKPSGPTLYTKVSESGWWCRDVLMEIGHVEHPYKYPLLSRFVDRRIPLTGIPRRSIPVFCCEGPADNCRESGSRYTRGGVESQICKTSEYLIWYLIEGAMGGRRGTDAV